LKTYGPGSKESAETLKAAAKKYHELYTKYEDYLAGLYARMWEGRCYKELGDTEKAFEAFEDLLAQPSEPQAFRLLKSKTLILLLETALLPEVKQERYQRLMSAQQPISLEINQSYVGRTLDVLVEGAGDGLSVGRSFRDAPEIDGMVVVEGEREAGQMVPVRITGALEYDLSGVVEERN